jgi:hypothetical protein
MVGRDKKEKKDEKPQKEDPTYVIRNVGGGTSCPYAKTRDEILQIPLIKDGKTTDRSRMDACSEAFKVSGLPSGISYSTEMRILFLNENAKSIIAKDPKLEKKLREFLGIDEKQKLDYDEKCS